MARRVLCLLLPLLLIPAPVRAEEAAIREKLRSRVKVTFEETPLRDVLKNFGQQAGVNFWIAEEEITADGGSLDHTVTLDWGEMQLDSALHFILDRKHGLTAVPNDQDVYVTTVTKAAEQYTTKVYPIGKILDGMQRETGLRFVSAHERRELLTGTLGRHGTRNVIRNYHQRFQGFIGQGFFQFGLSGRQNSGRLGFGSLPPTIGETIEPSWLVARSVSRSELAAALASVVRETVPDCWEQCDGVGGSLSIADESFVISIGPAEQEQIAVLLSAIEKMFTEEPMPTFRWAIRTGYPVRDDDALRKSLEQIGDFEAIKLPLDATLNQFAKQGGIRLWIDGPGIDADGGSLDVLVTFSAAQLPYETILTRLLQQYDLDFVIEDGVVVVNSMHKNAEWVMPAVYGTAGIPEAGGSLPSNYFPTVTDRYQRSQLLYLLSSHLGAWPGTEGDSQYASVFQLTPSVLIATQSQRTHRRIAKLLSDLRQRQQPGGPVPAAAKQPDVKPEFLTRVYPVFDPEAIKPSVTILKKLLANDQLKLIEVVKESIVIQCSDEGHIRAEAYFEAIESAHRRRHERIEPATPTPSETP